MHRVVASGRRVLRALEQEPHLGLAVPDALDPVDEDSYEEE
jgi:hypothetical protein